MLDREGVHMKRRYTTDDKASALRQLAANNDNAALTSEQTGIPESTLRHWSNRRVPINETQQLRLLRLRLIAEAMNLAGNIKNVIGEAPLNQRSTALNQMIDKILKITEILEEGEGVKEKTEVVVIEYGDDEYEYQIQGDVSEAESDFE
jgi:hypothetical protein